MKSNSLKESFNKIYAKSHLQEAENVETLSNGWKAKFKKGREKDTYDLLLRSPDGDTFIIREAAWWTQGFNQGFNVDNKMRYFIKTIFGYGHGNGEGKDSKATPNIRYIKYLKDSLGVVTDGIENGIMEGESSYGSWQAELE
jgi:hypothetical protein